MKKYNCSRCGIPLVTSEGVVPHYNLREPEWKRLGKKHEHFVCEECINKAKKVSAKANGQN